MYSEWTSLESEMSSSEGASSVLAPGFPKAMSKEVARVVLNTLANAAAETQKTRQQLQLLDEIPELKSNEQLNWTMEIICFALQMEFTDDYNTIQNAVEVYTSWLQIINHIFENNKSDDFDLGNVPEPMKKDPEPYIQKIMHHLSNLFEKRLQSNSDAIQMQGGLCSLVLASLRNVAHIPKSEKLSNSTWESLLKTLLKIGDILLSEPVEEGNLASIGVDELYMVTLSDVWLRACVCHFPTPSYWKTLQESVMSWRHHMNVVEKWCNVTSILTAKLCDSLHGEGYSRILSIYEHDQNIVPDNLSGNVLSQTWYRFLKIIGSPVDLIDPTVFTANEKFMNGITREFRDDMENHPSLVDLPEIFYRAIRGVSNIVEIFLGWETMIYISENEVGYSLKRDNTKRTITEQRSSVNSILNLLGDWLFEASLAGVAPEGLEVGHNEIDTQSVATTKDDVTVIPDLFGTAPKTESERYEEGRAEAVSTLCRLFSCTSSSQPIESVYLTRFFVTVSTALRSNSPRLKTAVVLNSDSLFRVDLPAVQTLIPLMMTAVEQILFEKDTKKLEEVCQDISGLRKSAITILLSILPQVINLPDLSISELPGIELDEQDKVAKIGDLQPRVLNLLNACLEIEEDDENTQLILSGLYYALEECSSREQDCLSNPNAPRRKSISIMHGIKKQTSFQLHSAYGLFVQCLATINDRLKSTWVNSLPATIAALELLSGIARLRIEISDPGECKRAVIAICEYISLQSIRPNREHKRELHSMIVAAYHCLEIWLSEHAYVLNDKGCLLEVIEIIEFGITGAKSVDGETTIAKDFKEQKPISKRVRHAAESLLILIFHGQTWTDDRLTNRFSCLNEEVLLDLICDDDDDETKFKYEQFRYFSINWRKF